MSKYKPFDESGLLALANYLKTTKKTADDNSSAVSTLEGDFQELVQQVAQILDDVDGCLGELDTVKADTAAVNTALSRKQDTLTFDTTPTSGSTNPVTSDGIYKAIGDIGSILDEINGEVV